MPLDPDARTVISALTHTPAFTHGLVRDLRIRWAFEEIGRTYRVQLFEGMKPRPDDYRAWQPFGQVPAFDDGEIRLFETGAILLHLGEQDERLMPRDPQGKADVIAWAFAALNSVEPMIMQLAVLDLFQAGQAWTREARPSTVAFIKNRLTRLAEALGERDWLAGRFSIADILMVTVLQNLRRTDILEEFPTLTAYRRRGEERAAFKQALADQALGLGDPVKLPEPA